MKGVTYKSDDRQEWNERTSVIKPHKVNDVLFSNLFLKYLPKDKNISALEIGAIPGDFLIFLHKRLGYRITGIDFAENEDIFTENMKLNKVNEFTFIKSDFFSHKLKKYDVVCSFGFIEHFDDYEDVIRRHCQIVNEGGYLIITMPNFRYLQYIYHRVFDKENLDIHNIEAMSPKRVTKITQYYGFEPLFAGYTGSLEIWRHPDPLSPLLERVNQFIERLALKLKSLPTSRLYSPYIVCIYKKSATK